MVSSNPDSISVQIAAVNRASGELQRVARDISKLDKSANSVGGLSRLNQTLGGTLKTAGSVAIGLTGFTVGLAALQGGFRGTIGAAIDFESSFAGIRKTVDATETEFAALEQANRNLAKSIPASVNEINRIGELAGQLGVRGVADIVKFERTIIDLTNTTNLAAEEAATAFAQIANIAGLPISDIDRLGSVVVALGNNFATTEADITNFTQRIAGAGRIAGLTIGEVAAIAASFASLGIEAEAGGTAVQKVLIDINQAVTTGNESLAIFAQTAGVTVEQFRNSTPIEQFTAFMVGLGRAGDDANTILTELGLTDQRLIRAFLSGAQNTQLFTDAIKLQSSAWVENTALTDEAAKRYETTASKIQIAQNNFSDLGITLGQAVTPAIVAASDAAVRFGPAMAGSIEVAGYGLAGIIGAVSDLTTFLRGAEGAAYALVPAGIAAGAAFAWLHPGAAIFVGFGLLAAGFYTAKQDSAELTNQALDFKIGWLNALLVVGEALKDITSFANDALGPLSAIPGDLGNIGRAAQEAYRITRERRNDLYLEIEAAKGERNRRGQSGFYDQNGNPIQLAPPGTYDVPLPPGYTPQSTVPTMDWPGMGTGGGGGGGGGASAYSLPPAISQASNQFAEMAAILNEAGVSSIEFQAQLELANEAQQAFTEAAGGLTGDAARAAIDLTKLGIVLGEAGISGSAFVAQTEMLALNEAFLKSGMAVDEFVNHIQGFTQELLAQAAALAKRVGGFGGTGVNAISAQNIDLPNGTRISVGGVATDEGLKKIIDRIARENPGVDRDTIEDEIKKGVRRTEPRKGRFPVEAQTSNTNYYAPVSHYNYNDTREKRETAAGLR